VPARVAGVLQCAALPSIGSAVSLDALLLARSAAWLCLAETAVTNTRPVDICWAPTLLLAGRDNAAVALWRSRTNEAQTAASSGSIGHGWNFLLQRPRAKVAYVYAASRLRGPI
jgi:hypothetical protein